MSRVLLSGYYGFDNLGDEAVLAATVAELRRRRPDLEILVLSASPDATARAHGVTGVPRAQVSAVVRALRAADLFLSGGGSLFQDATSWRSPWYYLAVLAAARRWSRRTAVYAQGFEPSRRAWVRAGLRRVLNGVDLVTVRDAVSARVLAQAGVRRPRVVVSADPSFLLDPDPSPAVERERARWGSGPLFGLAVRPWGDGRVLEAVAAAAREVGARYGARWVLLPMHRPHDVEAADAVAARLDGAIVVREPFGPREMLALTGGLDLLVAMRLHALIFAAAQGVPIVPVAYDRKVGALAEELGEEPPLPTDGLDARLLAGRIDAAAADRPARGDRLRRVAAALRERAALSPTLAVELLS
ncbi:MAG TPA: polysaccharide pyruvyl transferase CsaB [bacterium]|nr:polysaccharide pyruvyl transferase CsaB [bacterium]